MKFLLSLLSALAGLFTWSATSAATQYETAALMFADLGDYDPSDNTLDVISEEPLVIRISPIAYEGDSAGVMDEQVKRALLYGVYKPFIHTSVDTVTVSAVPVVSAVISEQPKYTISISREQALDAIRQFLPKANFSDLVGEYGWSDDFYTLYYADRDPGLNVFFDALLNAAQ